MRKYFFVLLFAMSVPAIASPDGAVQPGSALPAGDGGEVRARLLGWLGSAPTGASTLATPVSFDRLGSPFGPRADPFSGMRRWHRGVDVPGVSGTPVRASADGTVTRARRAGSYGNLVEIDHGDGVTTRYAHLREITVVSGTMVRGGDVVGLMGATGRATGAHLHFEVRVDGHAADPVERMEVPGATITPARSITPRWSGWTTGSGDRLPTASID
ncbi:MAG: hypothetical protein JWN21_174 [Sphingomonas bacterium]|uniref:M23 family metallopeptidase n=1 Tax=Sphingomonas bacterium TaxID=1895847 RepID=UPI002619031E|nr:M23 family metallopeptidase [Sphingomonas bacterium]MDB5694631.1 hypothetical protein [Sphingomonas bacterium]